MSPVEHELSRLEQVYRSLDYRFCRQPGASLESIRELEFKSGFRVDASLAELWQLSNGSDCQGWFADVCSEAKINSSLLLYRFLSIEKTLEFWSYFEPYGESHYTDLEAFYKQIWDDQNYSEDRDARIRPRLLRHRAWVPFASEGSGCELMFDADPSPQGTYGQIIEYHHDPDCVYYQADSTLALLKRTNDVLEASLTLDRGGTEAGLWFYDEHDPRTMERLRRFEARKS